MSTMIKLISFFIYFFVKSAGNSGYGDLSYPGVFPAASMRTY